MTDEPRFPHLFNARPVTPVTSNPRRVRRVRQPGAGAMADAEGWRYGVQHANGSVSAPWNGDSQLERARAAAQEMLRGPGPREVELVRSRVATDGMLKGWEPFGITCPRCRRHSLHPVDVIEGYCGACHWWTSDPELGLIEPPVRPGR